MSKIRQTSKIPREFDPTGFSSERSTKLPQKLFNKNVFYPKVPKTGNLIPQAEEGAFRETRKRFFKNGFTKRSQKTFIQKRFLSKNAQNFESRPNFYLPRFTKLPQKTLSQKSFLSNNAQEFASHPWNFHPLDRLKNMPPIQTTISICFLISTHNSYNYLEIKHSLHSVAHNSLLTPCVYLQFSQYFVETPENIHIVQIHLCVIFYKFFTNPFLQIHLYKSMSHKPISYATLKTSICVWSSPNYINQWSPPCHEIYYQFLNVDFYPIRTHFDWNSPHLPSWFSEIIFKKENFQKIFIQPIIKKFAPILEIFSCSNMIFLQKGKFAIISSLFFLPTTHYSFMDRPLRKSKLEKWYLTKSQKENCQTHFSAKPVPREKWSPSFFNSTQLNSMLPRARGKLNSTQRQLNSTQLNGNSTQLIFWQNPCQGKCLFRKPLPREKWSPSFFNSTQLNSMLPHRIVTKLKRPSSLWRHPRPNLCPQYWLRYFRPEPWREAPPTILLLHSNHRPSRHRTMILGNMKRSAASVDIHGGMTCAIYLSHKKSRIAYPPPMGIIW